MRGKIYRRRKETSSYSFVHSLCLPSSLKFITVNQGCPHGGIHMVRNASLTPATRNLDRLWLQYQEDGVGFVKAKTSCKYFWGPRYTPHLQRVCVQYVICHHCHLSFMSDDSIWQMTDIRMAKWVSKEVYGPQESSQAIQSYAKIQFQCRNWEKLIGLIFPLYFSIFLCIFSEHRGFKKMQQ